MFLIWNFNFNSSFLCLMFNWMKEKNLNQASFHAKTKIDLDNPNNNSPLQKREGTEASFLYWLDWKSKH